MNAKAHHHLQMWFPLKNDGGGKKEGIQILFNQLEIITLEQLGSSPHCGWESYLSAHFSFKSSFFSYWPPFGGPRMAQIHAEMLCGGLFRRTAIQIKTRRASSCRKQMNYFRVSIWECCWAPNCPAWKLQGKAGEVCPWTACVCFFFPSESWASCSYSKMMCPSEGNWSVQPCNFASLGCCHPGLFGNRAVVPKMWYTRCCQRPCLLHLPPCTVCRWHGYAKSSACPNARNMARISRTGAASSV